MALRAVLMMQNVKKIDWQDYTESIPAFLIIIGIPFSYSIADGLALGFISYAVVKAFSGRARNQLAYLPAGHCARAVFRLCAKPNWLAQIQASSGSGPSGSEGAVAGLSAPRRNA
jgi:xanthine/uracil/vitamin C permease (AzgA family)